MTRHHNNNVDPCKDNIQTPKHPDTRSSPNVKVFSHRAHPRAPSLAHTFKASKFSRCSVHKDQKAKTRKKHKKLQNQTTNHTQPLVQTRQIITVGIERLVRKKKICFVLKQRFPSTLIKSPPVNPDQVV